MCVCLGGGRHLLGGSVSLLVALLVDLEGGQNQLARAQAHVVGHVASLLLLHHLLVGARHGEFGLDDADANGDHDQR